MHVYSFKLILLSLSTFLLSMLLAGVAMAAENCQTVAGHLATAEGQVDVQRLGASAWREGLLGSALCKGDTVRAGANSRATVVLVNQAVLRIDHNTAMRLDNITGVTEERSSLSLLKGAFQSFSRKPRSFEVSTPYLNGSIEGTEFVFRVKDNESELTVLEGVVVASNSQGSVTVSGGESASAQPGQAPQIRTVVRPRDAVQWSLYYPPIMVASAQPSIQNAAVLLSVGRVDEARAEIDKALQQDPNAGEAYALSAVINVTLNNNEQALADANKAVTLSPDSSSALIALSYAQQAVFDIPGATDTLRQAVKQQPDDALAWARLSELQLMAGDRRQASVSAEKAVSLQPNIARAQITLGFAALAEFRNDDARDAFQKAINSNPSDPLPHLGLGLATISAGELEQGRAEIELAVALDSNDSLYRSYLGKSYFEEKRAPLDSEQFAIAKQLDPNDPTAYLYNGIALQTENRPVEAKRELERSIELNDNRAVFRSRLLLDKDRAARGTSLARAYNDLGFNQLGVNQSTASLTIDPANASAHRFLSDAYRGMRRRETARVSELLQAQLLQDVNINPVQPSISETNLNNITIGGPASPGFNEFTPLFQRNKTQFNVSGFGGNDDTYGGEAVITGLYDKFSFSAGAYSYNTDGWRPNNGVDQEVYSLYAQWAVTPELNLQAEFRSKRSTEGDLAFNFDPDNFFNNLDIERDRDTARLGLRYSPAENSNFLVSYIYSDNKEKREQQVDFDPVTDLFITLDGGDEGNQLEMEYIYGADRFDVIVGGAYYDIQRTLQDDFVVQVAGVGIVFEDSAMLDFDIKQPRLYAYSNIEQNDDITWTIGASYDDYEERDILSEQSFNPKLGVQWQVTEDTRLRAAAFKVLKPALTANRTIEPTQVAGFNQFFDDSNGTESWRYGVGFDARPRENLFVGGELTWRELDEPVFLIEGETGETSAFHEDRSEQFHKLYLNWTPLTELAVTAEISYDRFESDEGVQTEFGNLPEKVTTFSVPLGATYFHPNGFFAGLAGTYVDQEVVRSETSIQADGEDSFFLVDAMIGYRFGKRRGVASLGAKNLFDTEFNYQDDSYREFQDEPSTGPYFPSITVIGKLTLNF